MPYNPGLPMRKVGIFPSMYCPTISRNLHETHFVLQVQSLSSCRSSPCSQGHSSLWSMQAVINYYHWLQLPKHQCYQTQRYEFIQHVVYDGNSFLYDFIQFSNGLYIWHTCSLLFFKVSFARFRFSLSRCYSLILRWNPLFPKITIQAGLMAY